MRLLVDEARQDAVAHRLATAGHDTTHVRILGLAGHTDDEAVALALADERVRVTTDTDLVAILALTGATGPSVLLLGGIGDAVDERVEALLDVLPQRAMRRGCVERHRAGLGLGGRV